MLMAATTLSKSWTGPAPAGVAYFLRLLRDSEEPFQGSREGPRLSRLLLACRLSGTQMAAPGATSGKKLKKHQLAAPDRKEGAASAGQSR